MRIKCASLGYGALLTLIIVAANPATATAQSGIGYVTGGPALVTNLGSRDFAWQVGGGGERMNGPYGLGGGVDYVYFPRAVKTFDEGRGRSVADAANIAALSLNGSYYLRGRSSRPQPFVSGGLTFLLAGRETLGMLNVAGGFDWWGKGRAGLRFEVREQFPIVFPVLLSFRCGIVVR